MGIQLYFEKGTIVVTGLEQNEAATWPQLVWDPRIEHHRCPAHLYRNLVLELRKRRLPYTDKARSYDPLPLPLIEPIVARPYQREALEAWFENSRRGIVILPTGTGKTILALLIMARLGRPTLIHVPTIDLMHQWHTALNRFFQMPIGLWGGGHHQTEAITVTTYDSALRLTPHHGNRFGLIIFDECHRLPGQQYQYAAIANLAAFRLGLTATPERGDGLESRLELLVGEICYRAHIHQMAGDALSPYEVITIEVEMTENERERYEAASALYLNFLKQNHINMGHPRGWHQFLWKASLNQEGRAAFKAYLLQKRLSRASTAKDDWVWDLIQQHHHDRILIFTEDNNMAYRLGRRFFLPVLTHQTKLKERETYLTAFRDGFYPILITSKVLNEGIDVPEANVAIVVSGSGSVREHVQRLGRILRPQPEKRAILYELVARKTREYYVNKRRKRHHAYQRPGPSQDP